MTKKYLILLTDKKHANFFILRGQSVERVLEKHSHEYVPQKVKHGDDTWDATDKIFRHIQDHLHRYLQDVMKDVRDFLGEEHVEGIIIGSHKTLSPIIKKHLPQKLQNKIQGYVVIDSKSPFNTQLEKIKSVIYTLEQHQKFAAM